MDIEMSLTKGISMKHKLANLQVFTIKQWNPSLLTQLKGFTFNLFFDDFVLICVCVGLRSFVFGPPHKKYNFLCAAQADRPAQFYRASKTDLYTIYLSDRTRYSYRDWISDLCTKICVEIRLNSVIMQIRSLLLITIRLDGI